MKINYANFHSLLSFANYILTLRASSCCGVTDLAIVSNVATTMIEGVEHEMCLILGNGVAMERITRGYNLPGQPTQTECLVTRQEARNVSRLKATAPIITRDTLSDGLHFTLVTIRASKL